MDRVLPFTLRVVQNYETKENVQITYQNIAIIACLQIGQRNNWVTDRFLAM